MTARGRYTLLFGAVMIITALSVGSGGALLLGGAALFALLISLLSMIFALAGFRLSQSVGGGQTQRGGSCLFALGVRMFTPLPIAPLTLRVCLPSGRQSEFILPVRAIGETLSDNRFSCPHVGVFPVGVTQVAFSDCFGLFSLRRTLGTPPVSVTVLPKPRACSPLPFSPGEGESSIALRAQADRTTPADTRAWQDGDDLRRVHWKLSMRRQELMVHTYETPQRPDALVLLDCGSPALSDGQAAGGASRAQLIDALTESAAGVLKSMLDERRAVRLPLSGLRAAEISGQDGAHLPQMLAALASEPFSMQTDFVRILLESSRRMHRTGSAAVISSRLTPAVADAVIALARTGPRMRFMLVSAGPLSETQEQLLRLLRSSGVDTECVNA